MSRTQTIPLNASTVTVLSTQVHTVIRMPLSHLQHHQIRMSLPTCKSPSDRSADRRQKLTGRLHSGDFYVRQERQRDVTPAFSLALLFSLAVCAKKGERGERERDVGACEK